MYSLDTCILVALLRGDRIIESKIDECEARGEALAVDPVVIAELFKGAYLAARVEDAVRLVEDLVSGLDLLEFDEGSSRVFGQEFARLSNIGSSTQDFDLMIASIAMSHGAVLVTRNISGFEKIQGLKTAVW